MKNHSVVGNSTTTSLPWAFLQTLLNFEKHVTKLEILPSSKAIEASLRLFTPRIFALSSQRFLRLGYSLSDNLCFTLELMTTTATFGSDNGTALVSIDLFNIV